MSAWLRYPPRTIRARPCPTRQPRFATEALARQALLHGLAHTGLTPTVCDLCDGWHNRPRTLTTAHPAHTPNPHLTEE